MTIRNYFVDYFSSSIWFDALKLLLSIVFSNAVIIDKMTEFLRPPNSQVTGLTSNYILNSKRKNDQKNLHSIRHLYRILIAEWHHFIESASSIELICLFKWYSWYSIWFIFVEPRSFLYHPMYCSLQIIFRSEWEKRNCNHVQTKIRKILRFQCLTHY